MIKQSKKSKTILVVEDQIPILQILVYRFDSEGFNVIEAKNGKDGLELALKEHPDLILLDIILPKLDGIEMLKKLRADNWGKDVPVVILTNLSDKETLAKTLENQSYDFFVKSESNIKNVVKRAKEKLGLR